MSDRKMPSPESLAELETSYEHYQAVQRRRLSTFVRENGRLDGSPWSELIEAIERVLDERRGA